MLAVQSYLEQIYNQSNSEKMAFDELTSNYGIRCTFHEKEPLVILNYDQIESPKKPTIR